MNALTIVEVASILVAIIQAATSVAAGMVTRSCQMANLATTSTTVISTTTAANTNATTPRETITAPVTMATSSSMMEGAVQVRITVVASFEGIV